MGWFNNGHTDPAPEPRGETIPIIVPPWQIYASERPPTITGRHRQEPPEGR